MQDAASTRAPSHRSSLLHVIPDEQTFPGIESADESDRKESARRLAAWLGGVSAGVGVLTLLGWWLGIESLTHLQGPHMSVKANAGVGFVLAGAALMFQALPSVRTRGWWRADEITSSLVVLLGAATLVEWTAGVDLGIDELLVSDPGGLGAHGAPGRMAPATAFNFVLIGAALLLVEAPQRSVARMAHIVALVATLLGLVAIIGQLYGVGPSSGILDYSNQMAGMAALTFIVLSLGVQLCHPDQLLASLGTSDGPAAVLVRSLLPASLIVEVAVGWVHLEGRRAGYYGTELGLALYCTTNVIAFTALVAWIANAVEQQDRARREVERMLKQANDELELRVELRSAAISSANANLRNEILERKRAQEAEHSYAELVKVTIDHADHAAISFALDGTIRGFNPGAERLLGWRADEVVGRLKADAFHDPDELARLADQLSRELDGAVATSCEALVARARHGTPDENEWTYVRKDGTRFPVHLSVTALRDGQGKICGFLGIASDQTEKHRADAEVRELRRAMEFAIEGIARLDPAGCYVAVNAAYAATLGCSSEDLIGQPWQKTIQADAVAAMEQAYARMLKSGKVETDTVGVRRDGSTFDQRVVMVAQRGENGEFTGHYHFSKDISQQKEAERDLVRAKQAAETAMRARADFLARMSHEIRTPMNGVLGMTELALATRLSPQQREYIHIARDSATSLLHLIDEILDFSRIDSGHIRLESRPFRLRSCLASALKGLAQRAHAKGLDFLIDIPPEVPEELVGDPKRLVQVVINLVGNALKFTETGRIALSAAVDGTSRGAPVLRFAVSDTGIGIDPSKQHVIFDSFVQADDGVTRRYGGTGLGLAISRQLVEHMEGAIGVHSEPGRGSTFWFTARMERATGDAVEDDPLSALRGRAVLVVEEDPTRLRLVCELLQAWGMHPAGVDSAEAPPRPEGPFVLALLSAEQVDRRGADALADIDDEVPVVLVGPGPSSSFSFEGRPGAVVSVTWPITASDLSEATSAAHKQTSGRAGPPHLPAPGRVGLRVLLAEDNPVNRKVATDVLQRAGHAVVAVDDGRAAVAYAERNDVDVVLMDVQMPVMDGLTATRKIRESDRGGRGYLPVIGLTAQAMRDDRDRGVASGLDGYLVKPFEAASLLAEIDGVVARNAWRRESGAARRRRASLSGPAPFGRELVLERIGGDVGFLQQLIETFLQDLPAKRDAIATAVRTGANGDVQRVAHSLRGALLTLAAAPAAEAAAALERAAGSPEGTGSLAAALEQELERLVEVLSRSTMSA